jgi:hypothetical protein
VTVALYRDIEGVVGREPVGAVLAIGRKSSEKGNPIETDRFFIVQPNEERGVRPQHPAFVPFNGAEPALRQSVRGNFIHATIAEAWLYHLAAIRLPKHPNAPNMRPTCSGDGRRATRYMGEVDGREDWQEIECPNRLCAYRQGQPPACKPFGRLYFRPRWSNDKLPALLMKWETRAWRSISNVVGFFDHVSTQAEHLHLIPPRPEGAMFNPACPIYGLPFVLTMGRKTQAAKTGEEKGRAFPVVTLSPDADLIAYFMEQRKRLAEVGGHLQLAASNQDQTELEPVAIAAAYRALEPGIGMELPVQAIDWTDRAALLKESRRLVDQYAPARHRGLIREAWDVDGWEAVEKLSTAGVAGGVKFLRESE